MYRCFHALKIDIFLCFVLGLGTFSILTPSTQLLLHVRHFYFYFEKIVVHQKYFFLQLYQFLTLLS